ncbi:MAG: 30S ribosomal protein S13 [Patescibacteria group bacterium]|jgi:small subunit ribosomal protein S13
MARIAGINIPDNKRAEIGLSYIFGVGPSNVKKVLTQAKITDNPKMSELSEADIERIRQIIDKTIKVEGDLRQEIQQNIKRLKEIGAYRGTRHAKSLPVRGQRTKTNARSKRGKKVTVGSGRKPTAQKT